MKGYFDNVYYAFKESMMHFKDATAYLWEAIAYTMVGLTLPIWFIPYAIYKKVSDEHE